jgi:tRNA-dihydrouridine synthase A
MTVPISQQTSFPEYQFCVAPMLDWTDRYCRYFMRLMTRHARLYTEMVTTGALLHGNQSRHLDFYDEEHPIALQLGGSDPHDMALAAMLAEKWGYDEVNINCGCPSERVQKGAFGACLMLEPTVVGDCVKAMQDMCSLPVTIKHRIGIDAVDDYGFVRDFVGHARSAVLKGLSPKENRDIPPLKYDIAYQLKQDFPSLCFVVNGGITTHAEMVSHWQHVDGVMVGREAYYNPYLLAGVDGWLGDKQGLSPSRFEVVDLLTAFAEQLVAEGESVRQLTRHVLNLFHGEPKSKLWRRYLSDHKNLQLNSPAIFSQAFLTMQ